MRVRVLGVVLLTLAVVMPLRGVVAETEVTIGGEVRWRNEWDKRSFDPDATVGAYGDLRTRLSVDALVDSNARAFMQFQDSRRLGGRSAAGEYTSGTLVSGFNVDMHQAYVEILKWTDYGLSFKGGRFEVALGNERVFGTVGWSNVGRSWEGVEFGWKGKCLDVRFLGLWRRELGDEYQDRDYKIAGLVSAQPKIGSELFVFRELDSDKLVEGASSGIKALDRISLGGHIKRAIGPVTLESNLVYQFGERRHIGGDGYFAQDISAFLVTAEISGVVHERRKIALGAGVDYASGDDDPNDDTFSGYDNLYYTGHKFRGHMDYFVESRPEGLVDIIARASGEIVSGWMVGAHFHHFMSAADYVGAGGAKTNKIGSELDVFWSTREIRGALLNQGVSAFFPSRAYSAAGADPAIWWYWMMTVAF